MILFELLAAAAILVPCGAALHYRRRLAVLENVSGARLAALERARESKYRALTENADDVVVRYDRDCRRTYVNPAWERINGATAAAALGKTPSEMAPRAKPVAAEIEATLHRAMAEGRTHQMEFCWEDETGDKVWYELRATPEFGADGAIVGVLTVARDISARKRIETELREKTLLHATLLNALIDAGMQLMLIENGRVAYVGNRALARRAGWSDAEIDARPKLLDIIHPDDRARVADYHRRRLAGEAVPSRYELALQGPAGERIEYETAVSLVPGDKTVRAVTVSWEIGERKRAERDLLLLRRALDCTPESFFLIGEDSRFADVNAAACRALGYRREELLGMTPFDIDPDASPEQVAELNALPDGTAVAFETRHRARDGRIFPVDIVAAGFAEGDTRYGIAFARDISERKRMEAETARRAREFRTLAETLPEPIIRYGLDGRRRYVNPAYERFFGIAAGDALGKTVAELSSLDNASAYQENLLAVARGECRDFEVGARTDGQSRIYRMQLVPERGEDGAVTGVLTIGHDITELKAAQAHMARFLANAPGYVYTIRRDAAGRDSLPFVSPGIENLLGLKPETLKDDMMPLRALYHPEDRARLLAAFADSAARLAPVRVEYRVFHPERGELWAESRAMPERQADGEIHWHGIVFDITERKRAQLRLELMEAAVDNSSDAILLTDPMLRLTYANAAACDMLGYARDELPTLSPQDIDPEALLHACMDALARATPEIRRSIESSFRARDGRAIPVEFSVARVEHQGARYCLAVARDIAERKRLHEALAERERRFRTVAEGSSDLIFRYDRDGRRLYVNPAVSRLFGAPAEALLGKTPTDNAVLQSYDGNRGYQDAIRTVFERRGIVHVPVVYPDGDRLLDFDAQLIPELDETGRVVSVFAVARDITAIREAERRLAHFIDNLPGLAYTCHLAPDGKMRFPFVSAEVEEIYGIAAADATHDMAPIHALAHPEDRPRIEAAIAASARDLTPFHVESRVCRPDHPERWLDVRSVPERQPDGGILWYGLMLDITERKRMEQALAAREQEFRSLAENSPEPIFRYDRQCRRIYVNPMVERTSGIPREKLLGKTPTEMRLVPTQEDLRVQQSIQHVLDTGERHEVEVPFYAPDGREMWFHNIHVPEFGAGGTVASVLSIGRDVTNRHRLEEELRERVRLQEQLEQREREFRTLAENLPVAVIRYDVAQRRRYLNPAAERMLHGTADQLLGQVPGGPTVPATPTMLKHYRDEMAAVMATDAARELDFVLDAMPAAEQEHYEVRFVPEHGEYGKPASVLAIWYDITERQRMEEQLRLSQKQFQHLLAHREDTREDERRRIAHDLHEELGQLLTALRMSITTLPLQYGTALPALLDRSRAMTALVDRTLKGMRDTVAALRPTALDAGLAAGIEWLADEFKTHAGLDCDVMLPEDEPNFDEARAIALFRIVQEALTNIARHAGARHIDIALEEEDGYWRLDIRDDGRGFDPAAPDRKGFGLLGMRERVAMLGGELQLDSAPGRGTTLTVRIPLGNAADAAPPAPSPAP